MAASADLLPHGILTRAPVHLDSPYERRKPERSNFSIIFLPPILKR
jgi:hypothetical protein